MKHPQPTGARRLISLVLALAMAAAMLPASALAVEGEGGGAPEAPATTSAPTAGTTSSPGGGSPAPTAGPDAPAGTPGAQSTPAQSPAGTPEAQSTPDPTQPSGTEGGLQPGGQPQDSAQAAPNGNPLMAAQVATRSNAGIYVSAGGDDANGNGSEASPYATLSKAYEVVAAGGTITVVGEVSQPAAANITVTDKAVTIMGTEGGKLLRASGNTTPFITVSGTGSVTLTNITLDGDKANSPLSPGGTSNTGDHALVSVAGGTLAIGQGASLTNNQGGFTSSGSSAGGLRVTGGRVDMTGGSITGNECRYGAGVELYSGIFNMTGGSITDNAATDGREGGGGLYIYTANASAYISGGAVINNNTSGGKTASQVQSASENKGPDVQLYRGYLRLNADANGQPGANSIVIGGLYLYEAGKTVDVYASKDAQVGIAMAQPGQISTKGGHVAGSTINLSNWKSLGNQGVVDVQNGYIVLAKADVYVKSDGNDATGDGTAAKPYATLKKAYDALSAAGGTIHVMDRVAVPETFEFRKPIRLTGTGAMEADVYSGAALVRTGVSFGVYDAAVTVKHLTLTDQSNHNNAPIGVHENGTLTLGDGAIVTGFKSQFAPVFLYPEANVKLIMEDGAKITGNACKAASGNVGAPFVSSGGGGVFVGGGTTFEMRGGTIEKGTSYAYGGGVFVNGAFTMSGGSINGTATTQGGGVYVNASGSFTMSEGAITGTAPNGGGVFVRGAGGTFTMSGGSINGTASGNGGGVNNEDGKVTLSGGAVTGTAGGNGGGVFHHGGVNTTLNGAAIRDSKATRGGGLYVNMGNVRLDGGSITGCTASQQGGGVYVNDGYCQVNLTGGSVTGNQTTGGSGGGVYMNGGTLTLSGSASIANNTSSASGAGVTLNGNGNSRAAFNMQGGSVTGNKATGGQGGGVYVGGSGNAFNMSGGSVTNNQASGNGGGVVLTSGGAITLSGSAAINSNTKGGAANNLFLPANNYITVSGGLTCADGGIGVTCAAPAVRLRISNGGAASAAKLKYDVDGLYTIAAENNYLVLGGRADQYVSTAKGNDATGNGTEAKPWKTLQKAYDTLPGTGGAIHIMDAVDIPDIELRKPLTLTGTNGVGAPYQGAALGRKGMNMLGVYAAVEVNHLKLTEAAGHQHQNAPIGVDPGGTLTLGDGALITGFKSNFAPVFIYPGGGKLIMEDGANITGNRCLVNNSSVSTSGYVASAGGGVYVGIGGTFTMNGGEIYGNTGYRYGGGVFVQSPTSKFEMTGGTIRNSTAVYGGGVYLNAGKSTLGGSITGNTAQHGGGVYINGGANALGGGITGNTAHNSASNGHGGGVYINNGANTLAAGVSITGNQADVNGGGVTYLSGGSLALAAGAVDVTGNTVGGAACNLFLGANKFVNVAGGVTGGVGVTHAGGAALNTRFGVAAGQGYALDAFTLDMGGAFTPAYQGTSNNLIWTLDAEAVYVSNRGSDTAGDGTFNKPFKTLGTAYSVVKAGGTIHVKDSVPMLAANNITVSKTVTIQGADSTAGAAYSGGRLARQSGNTGRLITVNAGGSVTLKDISLDGGGFWQNVSSRSGGQLVFVNGGQLTLGSGAVLERNRIDHPYSDYGSAIYLSGGTVNMEAGAAIRKNMLTGAYADGAAISSIYGNGVFNMAGGEISGNTASRMGSAIRWSNGTFNMTGGSITGNGPAAYGAVSFHQGTFKVGGSASITGNQGANLYLWGTKAVTVAGSLSGRIGVTTQDARAGVQVAIGGKDDVRQFTYDPGGLVIAAGTGGAANNLFLAQQNDYYVSKDGSDANGNGTKDKPYKTLAKAYAMLPNANGTIYVMDTAPQPAPANITSTKTFTLKSADGATGVLLRQAGNTGAFINITGGAVTLENVALDGNKGGVTAAQALVNVTGGSLRLNTGAKLQNNNGGVANGGSSAGGLRIAGTGAVTMEAGASITGNLCNYGGGVELYAGTFTVNGGSITGNAATNGSKSYGGGGVYMYGGTLTLNGGSITGNTSGGETSAGSNHGQAPCEGPDVEHYRGALNLSGGAKVGGLHLYGGNTMEVDASFSGNVGVTVNPAPAQGAVRRVSSNNGHGTVPGVITSLGNQGTVTTESGYIVLSGKSGEARLDYVDRNALYGETATYPAVGGVAKGDANYCAETMTITVPFAQGAKNFNVSAYAAHPGAKIVAALETGTTADKVAVSTANGVNTVVKYNPAGVAAGGTFASFTYTVTAEDGVTAKAYTVNVVRGQIDGTALGGAIDLTVNFDTTAALTAQKTGIDLVVPDAAGFSIGKAANADHQGITVEKDTVSGKLQANVPPAYYENYLKTSTGLLNEVSNAGRYTISRYEETDLALWYNGAKLCKVNLYTTTISVSEAAAVDEVVQSLSASGAFKDMYQNGADVPGADNKQEATEHVTTEALAEQVMAKYALDVGKTALTGAFGTSGSHWATIKVFGKTGQIGSDQRVAIGGSEDKTLVLELQRMDFQAATAGAAPTPDGTDGIYRFKVVVTLGKQSTTNDQSVPIHAHKFAGMSMDDLKAKLLGNNGPFYDASGNAKLAGTVVVDADATPDAILAAVKAKMESAVKDAVTNLSDGTIDYTVKASPAIAYKAQALADGNFTATLTVVAAKGGEETGLAVTVPLKMTVEYRKAVDDLVAEAIEDALNTALSAGSPFADVADNQDADFRTASKLEAHVKGKLQAALDTIKTNGVEIDRNEGTTAGENKETIALTGYTLTPSVAGRIAAPKPGTAGAPEGVDGQYIFTASVSVRKGGNETASFAPGIAPSGDPVKKTDGGGAATDNGVYITAYKYEGVSDAALVGILNKLLGDTEAKLELTYEQRNDSLARKDAVKKWADATIKSAASVTLADGTQYTLQAGKVVSKKAANGTTTNYAGDLQGDLNLADVGVALSGAMTAFTSTTTAANTAGVQNNYTLTLSMGGVAPATVTKQVTFTHTAGVVKGTISGGTGPYTITLIDPDGNTFTVQTDQDGNYELKRPNGDPIPDGDYQMVVQDKDNAFSTSTALAIPAAKQVQDDTALGEGAAVFGTVTMKEGGAAVAGAGVSAPGHAGGRAEATSKTNGYYGLANVKAGQVDVVATKDNNSGAATRQDVPSASPVNIQLSAGKLLTGNASPLIDGYVTVYDKDGKEISRAAINPDGSYTLAGLADSDEYAVAICGKDDNGQLLSGVAAGVTDLEDAAAQPGLSAGGLLTGLGTGGTVVLDGGEASGKQGTRQGARYFFPNLPAGDYDVTVTGTLDGSEAFGQARVSHASGLTEMDIPMRKGAKVSGTVTLPAGAEYPATLTFVNKATGEAVTVDTDANGNFTALLPDGDYELGVEDAGGGYSAKQDTVKVAAGALDPADALANLAFKDGALLRGKVVDAAGAPVMGAKVSSAGAADAASVGGGMFMLAGVPKGNRVAVTAVKGGASGLTETYAPNQGEVTVKLQAGLLVKSRQKVTLPDGTTPAAGAKVTLTGPDGKTYQGVVDSGGALLVPGVPASPTGPFSVAITDSLGRTGAATGLSFAENGDGTATLDLGADPFIIRPDQEATGAIVGTLQGDLIAGAKVELYYENRLVDAKTTGADGKFTFADLPYAPYKLVVARTTGSGGTLVNTFNMELKEKELKRTLVLPTAHPEKETLVDTSPALGHMSAEIDPVENFQPTDGATGFTQAEIGGATRLELLLRVREETSEAKRDEILTAASAKGKSALALLMDMRLFKRVDDRQPIQIFGCRKAVAVVVAVPGEYQGKAGGLSVWYTHGGVTKQHGAYSFFNVGGTDYCQINADEYSTYALVYTEPAPSGGGGGGGGASGYRYTVTLPGMPKGYGCTLPAGVYPAYGDSFTFTIRPEPGYSLGELLVRANGVLLQPDSEGRYTLRITEDTLISVVRDKPVPKTGDPLNAALYAALDLTLALAAGWAAHAERRREAGE